MSDFVMQQFYRQKKFKPGELRNAVLRLIENFNPAGGDVRVFIRYPGSADREADDGLRELHNVTALNNSPYGIVIYLGDAEIFFGRIKKSLQLGIRKCGLNNAVMMRRLFEADADLSPRANTCFYCGSPNINAAKMKTVTKKLGVSVTGAAITRQYFKKEIAVPQCRRCARLAALIKTLFVLLTFAGWAVWIYCISVFAHTVGPAMIILLLIGFPLLTTGVAFALVFLLSKLLRFNFQFLDGLPEYKELKAEGWH
ncbi:MAG: hypothetical protein ACOX7P_06475 [Oscillospiraceae bacterium]|jgi:hypothetical protein